MALNRYDPFFARSPFDDFFTMTPFSGSFPTTLSARPSTSSMLLFPSTESMMNDFHSPRFNAHPYQVREDDKAYTVSVDVPGLKPEDMTVNVDDTTNVLHLKGERKYTSPDGKTYSERSFSYSMTLGDNVEGEKLTANLEHGVLTLTAPKKPPKEVEPPKLKTRKINISTTIESEPAKMKIKAGGKDDADEKKETH
jgi:HSP20 family protein